MAASVEAHLAGKGERAAALYRAFVEAVEACGLVTPAPAKTRIGFQVRMIFAAVSVRPDRPDGHVVLAPRLEHPRFHVHHFRFHTVDEIGGEMREWLRQAYAVGEQSTWGGDVVRLITPRTGWRLALAVLKMPGDYMGWDGPCYLPSTRATSRWARIPHASARSGVLGVPH